MRYGLFVGSASPRTVTLSVAKRSESACAPGTTGAVAAVLGATTTMLLDYLAGRRSEIDAINGMVPVVAAEVGTAAPFNEVVSALVRANGGSFFVFNQELDIPLVGNFEVTAYGD